MKISAKTVFSDPVNFIAFGFGSGLAPKAPGTFGTLVAIPIALVTLELGLVSQLVIASLFIVAGVYICGESARRIGVHDHGGIVWDEIAAFYPVLLFCPATPLYWAVAFGVFRFYDIVKPWPIRDLDHRLHGGLGIMLDDIVAALYTALTLGFAGWLIN